MTTTSLLLIGGGNMGMALAQCWLDAFENLDLTIAETNPERRAALQAQGFHAPDELELPDDGFDAIILAVKPQGFSALLPQLQQVAGESTIISIMAGITLKQLSAINPHVARVMPNTPVSIAEGMSAICAPALDDDRLALVKELFGATGHIVMLDDEAQMHDVTAISGSGPAYVFAFMEALEAAAMHLGLDATTARALVVQTVRGAALLADAHSGDAATLRTQVTSPGGTTQAALKQLETHDLSGAVAAAVKAARARSEELAQA
ncbi:MAG: pyrroline-5-carboxylate reductase [Azospirillum brasilense]|nr:MAG: pyrroline-5-carboxylate reductase [Azospirillum brasilense]